MFEGETINVLIIAVNLTLSAALSYIFVQGYTQRICSVCIHFWNLFTFIIEIIYAVVCKVENQILFGENKIS